MCVKAYSKNITKIIFAFLRQKRQMIATVQQMNVWELLKLFDILTN